VFRFGRCEEPPSTGIARRHQPAEDVDPEHLIKCYLGRKINRFLLFIL